MNSRLTQTIFNVFAAMLLVACASTQMTEETPATLNGGSPAAADATIYPEGVAGTVEDLYGNDAALGENKVYQDAIEQNPSLRYNIIYFDFNRSDISAQGDELIRQHGEYLKKNSDVFAMLEGHADKRGSEGYNLALGERRAQAVKGILLFYGVPANQLSTISFGEEKPAIFGNNEAAFSKNRRVEIIYQ